MATIFHYDWDQDKAAANLAKHKVSFDDARTIFEDPLALTMPDSDNAHLEERWITIGSSRRSGLLLVVHTHVETTKDAIYIRLISARKPTRHERRQYEQESP